MRSVNHLSFVTMTLCPLSMMACLSELPPDFGEEQEAEIDDVSDLPTPSSDLDDVDSGWVADTGEEASDSADDEPAQTVTYEFGSDDSLLYIQVWKDESAWGSGWAMMRDSRLWLDRFGDLQRGRSRQCALSFSVPVDDLIADEDAMREYVGLEGTISSSDRSTIKEHMLSSEQLDSSRYKEIEFNSSTCSSASGSNGSVVVVGSMKLRGQSEQISVTLNVDLRGGQLYISGELDITATQFGFEPYSAYAGAVRNMDEMTIVLDLVGSAQ